MPQACFWYYGRILSSCSERFLSLFLFMDRGSIQGSVGVRSTQYVLYGSQSSVGVRGEVRIVALSVRGYVNSCTNISQQGARCQRTQYSVVWHAPSHAQRSVRSRCGCIITGLRNRRPFLEKQGVTHQRYTGKGKHKNRKQQEVYGEN